MDTVKCSQDTAEASFSKKKRTMFNEEQKSHLEQQFLHNPYPDKSQRKRLAEDLGVKDKSIDYWFGHRRAKQAKCKRSSNNELESRAPVPQAHFIAQKTVEQKADVLVLQDSFGTCHYLFSSPFLILQHSLQKQPNPWTLHVRKHRHFRITMTAMTFFTSLQLYGVHMTNRGHQLQILQILTNCLSKANLRPR